MKIAGLCLSLMESTPVRFSTTIALAILFSMAGHGQWTVNVLAGGGVGRMRTDLFPTESRGEYQVVDRLPSWFFGATASHTISGYLSFSTGLNWMMIAGHDEHWIRGYPVMVTDRQVHYVCLPTLVNFEFRRLRLGGGYQLGVPIQESGTFQQNYAWLGLDDETYSTSELGLKKLDFGIVAELAYRPLDRFSVCARYYYGLQDIKDHTDGMMSPLSNEQFIVAIGYQLFPKTKARSGEDPEPILEDTPQE